VWLILAFWSWRKLEIWREWNSCKDNSDIFRNFDVKLNKKKVQNNKLDREYRIKRGHSIELFIMAWPWSSWINWLLNNWIANWKYITLSQPKWKAPRNNGLLSDNWNRLKHSNRIDIKKQDCISLQCRNWSNWYHPCNL